MSASIRPSARAAFVLLILTMAICTPRGAAAQGGIIRGQVVDPDGRPVPGAVVLVEGATAAPHVAEADAQGNVEVTLGTPGRFTVRATAPGLASPGVAVEVASGATVPVTLALRLVAVDERLVVSAAQIGQPLTRVPDSTTVLDGATLAARQQFTLGQALRSVPGMGVAQSGGPGALTSLFTRGGESDYTLVLVDGVRANGFGGGFDFSQLLLADVDRVEVVRGPQSSLYGADAIGGVIHVITRSGGAPSVQGLLETGSRDMRRGAASTSGSARGLRWQVGGDYLSDEGFTGLAHNGETVSNDDSRMAQASAVLGWQAPASGTDLQAAFRYTDTDRGTPGAFGSDPAGRFFGVDHTSRNLTTRRSAALRWVQPWFGASSRVRQRTEFDVADFDLESVSSFPSRGETRRTHVRTQTDISAGTSMGASAGAEWLDERGRSTFITAEAGPVPVERTVAGFFGEVRWAPADRLSMTAGARAERIHRSAFPGDPTAFTPRPDFPADTVVSVNPKVAANWMLAGTPGQSQSWTRVHGAAGTGIRPPDAFEIAFTNNPGLKPERSRSVEAGVAQVLAGGAVQLDATVFINSYDDLIISVGSAFTGVSRWSTDNISNARARGVELTGAWRPAAAWSVQGTYTFLSTEVLAVDGLPSAPPPYSVGDPLLRRPRHQASLDAVWTESRVSAFAQVLMRGAALDAEPAFGPTGGLYTNPASAVANLGGSFRVARGVAVQARVLNLLDTAYEEVLGFPAPRRTAYVGVSIAARR